MRSLQVSLFAAMHSVSLISSFFCILNPYHVVEIRRHSGFCRSSSCVMKDVKLEKVLMMKFNQQEMRQKYYNHFRAKLKKKNIVSTI